MNAPPNLAEVSSRHQQYLGLAGTAPIADAELLRFIDEVRAAGTFLEAPRDRTTAVRIMSYWTGEAIRRGLLGQTSAQNLLPFGGTANVAGAGEASPPALSDAEIEKIARARAQARISSAARQWRATRYEGYLLKGKALDEARLYTDQDADIATLVRASQSAAMRGKRIAIVAGALLGSVVIGLLLFAKSRAENAARFAQEAARFEALARREAEAKAGALAREKDAEKAISTERAQLLAEGDTRRDAAERTIASLNRQIEKLRDDLRDLREEYGAHPQPLRPALATGFDPQFLGRSVPLPVLSAPLLASTLNNGVPSVVSLHFSVVTHAARAMPLLTASNIDRGRLVRDIQRPLLAPVVDAGAPASAQIKPEWYVANRSFDRAHLVAGPYVAWGENIPSDPRSAGLLVFSATDTNLNAVPQFKEFNRGIWNDLESYAVDGFRPASSRISVFSGPVFQANDPVRAAVRVPRAFWKVLVAADPAGRLIVEAYLLSQFDRTGEAAVAFGDLDRAKTRVHVADIEALTGLDFGDDLRNADAAARATVATRIPGREQTPGERLAARAPLLDAPSPEWRDRMVGDLKAFFKITPRPDVGQMKQVLDALLDLTELGPISNASGNGRYNLARVIAEVPLEVWRDPAFSAENARARHTMRQLCSAIEDRTLPAMPQARAEFARLKEPLALPVTVGISLTMQIAGMTLDKANGLAKCLGMLSWTIDSIERAPVAAGVNALRYNPGDEARALALQGDLQAMKRPVRLESDARLNTGMLELLVSD